MAEVTFDPAIQYFCANRKRRFCAQDLQAKFQDQWADLFLVSAVEVSDDPALYAQAAETPVAGVRVLVVKGWFMSLKRTFRTSSLERWGIACQISSQVKARIGAKILVMVSRIR